MTVHFVYVHNNHINTTSAIGREIPKRLQERFDVRVHHPNEEGSVYPSRGDILIGHPNRYGPCFFSRSFAHPGWARRIVFAPLSLGMLEDAAAIDPIVQAADICLAITGAFWFDSIAASPISHWQHKTMRCDLGVNRDQFPNIKSRFNPAGRRRFLYIGNADPMRGGDFLMRLANANPELEIGWIRASDSRHCLDSIVEPQTRRLAKAMANSRLKIYADVHWHRPEGLKIIADHDFLLHCGRSDAMPSEVLEAASWGLVPVTTPQCGFPEDDWMTHIPLDDIGGASAILQNMNTCADGELFVRQAAGFRLLESQYNWDHVTDQVRAAIEAPLPVTPADATWQQRARRNSRMLKRHLLRTRYKRRIDAMLQRFPRPFEGVIRRDTLTAEG